MGFAGKDAGGTAETVNPVFGECSETQRHFHSGRSLSDALRLKFQGCILRIAGSGSDLAEVRRRVADLDCADQVEFLGHQERAETPRALPELQRLLSALVWRTLRNHGGGSHELRSVSGGN